MVIAISGMSGFIGKKLAEFYKDEDVRPIDRSLLEDRKKLTEYLRGINPDVIIHAAAYGNMSYQKDEEEIFNANVVKTWNLLSASKDIPYKAFINISSSSVYGDKKQPMSETDTLDTETFYGCTKASGEYLCRAFRNQYNKPIVSVRPFSVYGPGEASFRFIPTVCRALIEDKEFNLDPFVRHDWIYIDDFVKVVDSLTNNTLKEGHSINVGTGASYTNIELVLMLAEISEKKPRFRLINTKVSPVDWRSSWSSIKSYKDHSIFDEERDIENGLRKVWEYESKIH